MRSCIPSSPLFLLFATNRRGRFGNTDRPLTYPLWAPARNFENRRRRLLHWQCNKCMLASLSTPTAIQADGRSARAARTRDAVVEALLTLIEEGDLRPTAQRVAEHARVSLRSVFQHFRDLESLFAAAA